MNTKLKEIDAVLEELGQEPGSFSPKDKRSFLAAIEVDSNETPQETINKILIRRNIQAAKAELDNLHAHHLINMAQIEEKIRELIGDKYPEFVTLSAEIDSTLSKFQTAKEKLRKNVINPAVLAGGQTVYSRFYRIEFQPGRKTVDRLALLEWAKETDQEEAVEAFVKTGGAYTKVITVKKKK